LLTACSPLWRFFVVHPESLPLGDGARQRCSVNHDVFSWETVQIPRETTIKDVVAGARWPRQSNAPVFEDLRRAPRKRDDEIDGIELALGWMMEVYVVTNDKLGAL
jgi:hypothetical protein